MSMFRLLRSRNYAHCAGGGSTSRWHVERMREHCADDTLRLNSCTFAAWRTSHTNFNNVAVLAGPQHQPSARAIAGCAADGTIPNGSRPSRNQRAGAECDEPAKCVPSGCHTQRGGAAETKPRCRAQTLCVRPPPTDLHCAWGPTLAQRKSSSICEY